MAFEPMFCSSATNCALLMKEKAPPKRSMPPQPARRLGNWALTSG
jgi:hypothetical protein